MKVVIKENNCNYPGVDDSYAVYTTDDEEIRIETKWIYKAKTIKSLKRIKIWEFRVGKERFVDGSGLICKTPKNDEDIRNIVCNEIKKQTKEINKDKKTFQQSYEKELKRLNQIKHNQLEEYDDDIWKLERTLKKVKAGE